MDTRDECRQRFQREQGTKKRLRLATTRLHEAEHERIWAIVAARDAGLSIRQIAAATGLSRSRIHQLLEDPEARERPTWLTHVRGHDHASGGEAARAHAASPAVMQARVADEVEVWRWGIDWLAQLERGELVAVNRRPDTEDVTEFVRFDQARVRRVPARMAADLDALARHGPAPDTETPAEPTAPARGTGSAWPNPMKSPEVAPRKNHVRHCAARLGCHRIAGPMPSTSGRRAGRTCKRRVQQTGRERGSFGSVAPGRPRMA